MRYMLLIHTDEPGATPPPTEAVTKMSADYAAYTEAMRKAGVNLGGERLQPSKKAAVVRVRDGKRQVLDGPYVDTKEQFGGYYIIDVPTLEDAVTWAERCPAASRGTVEVRPIWELR
jgi:hypothetical protein